VRHIGMKLAEDIIVIRLALRSAYRTMVANRLKKNIWYGHVRADILHPIETKLEDARLAKLFVEAQFHAMPPEWCMEKFGRRYPPTNVVFGGQCWDRYYNYIDRGIRDAF